MSEEHTPPKPTTKTSAVPLKKETVRITLRPNAPGADAPPATVPLSPPPRPSFGAPPAPTVPLSPPPRPSIGGAPPPPSGAPSGPPAPTPAPGAPPRPAPPVAPVGSKTIPLGAAPPRPAAPGAPRPAPAGPGAPVGGGTQPLPPRSAATIARPSAPTAAISSAPIRTTAAHDEDLEVDDGPLNILAVVALVASLAAAFLVFASVDSWPMSYGFADTTARKADWEKDNDVPGFKLPLDYSPFDSKVEGGTVSNKYESVAPKLPAPPTLE
ncbi:MAG: hypothetical protein JWM59_1898 [Verrucomicrobiales bacterium]|nr:hypothetical protein [Verrucomicrobiales bacterium]